MQHRGGGRGDTFKLDKEALECNNKGRYDQVQCIGWETACYVTLYLSTRHQLGAVFCGTVREDFAHQVVIEEAGKVAQIWSWAAAASFPILFLLVCAA